MSNSGPTIEPVTLAEAKKHLRLETADEDDLVEALIVAAREHAEKSTGLVLAKRTIVESAAALGRWIDLAAWPIAPDAPIAISYLDGAGETQTIASTAWRAMRARRPVRLLPLRCGWDVPGGLAVESALPVAITVEAGYEPTDVPAAVKAAMLLIVGHLYANRGGGDAAFPSAIDALLRPYRLIRV